MALGSWPQRKEFTYEALNRADTAVMCMKIRPLENKAVAEAKVMTAQAYAFQLVQRARIEQYVFNAQLHINTPGGQKDSSDTTVLRALDNFQKTERYRAYRTLKDQLV